ncbi:HAD family phosphatase [Carboxylicivirga mesophila]|uniref:HAD family phosphatase n=1 Tax=Carboxylicivirga mesophila TaxID=1166478 RepID=A0ABS5K493_9BACT|nr:HAD family phosphatase [Carboxylicivirga mesophila]MBS2209849.1 HAD family phosphatase [Carboxylicivirga mesophila]
MKTIDFSAVDAYLFDLGGVIVDISPQAAIDAFAALGFNSMQEHINQSHHEGLFKQYELGAITDGEFIAAIQRELPNGVEPSQIIAAWNAMLVSLPDERVTLLNKLRNEKPVYLLSNTNAIHRETFIGMANDYGNLENLFTDVFYSYRMQLSKPDVRSFKYVIKKTSIDPRRTLFLDDSLANLEAAASLGFQTELVTPERGVLEIFNEL